MKIARNAPCPCGSGKKYKFCCMAKNEAAEKAQREQLQSVAVVVPEQPEAPDRGVSTVAQAADEVLAETAPEIELDPLEQDRATFWEEIEVADEAQLVALVDQAIARPGFLDNDLAFDAFERVYSNTIEAGKRDRFDTLVEKLKQAEPAVYLAEARWLLQWRITNALVAKRNEAVASLTREFGQLADGEYIDDLFSMVAQLAYHGHSELIKRLVDDTLPMLRKSNNLMPGAVDEFAAFGVDGLIIERLERGLALDLGNEDLVEQFKWYWPQIDLPGLTTYIALLVGQSGKTWSLADFDLNAKPRNSRGKVDPDAPNPYDLNVRDLCLEFAGYLNRERDVSYPKALMARDTLSRYLRMRAAGQLEPRPGLLENLMAPGARPPKRKKHKPAHVLCPDYNTLDHYMADRLQILNPQFYEAAALFEMIPEWISFLKSRQLIDAEQQQNAIKDFRRLCAEMLKLWAAHTSDPSLYSNLDAWMESATGEP